MLVNKLLYQSNDYPARYSLRNEHIVELLRTMMFIVLQEIKEPIIAQNAVLGKYKESERYSFTVLNPYSTYTDTDEFVMCRESSEYFKELLGNDWKTYVLARLQEMYESADRRTDVIRKYERDYWG